MEYPERDKGIESLYRQIIDLHQLFERHEVPHAFGGAIALAYHSEPRATADIDLNVFVATDESPKVIRALDDELIPIENEASHFRNIVAYKGTTIRYGVVSLDLFFSFTDFHDSAAERVRHVEFGEGIQIPILSAEDLIVFKGMYNRPSDWTDIEKIMAVQGDKIDHGYIQRWLRELIKDPDDPRFARLKALEQ